jgi:hypothetical protein
MARLALLAVCGLMLVATASAQFYPRPDNYIASGDQCRNSGARYGPSAASSACQQARQYCSGPQGRLGAAPGGIGAVSLPQCSNIAFGSCQQAGEPGRSPCAREVYGGYGSCGAQQFQSLYTNALGRSCYQWAQSTTNVNPGTNQWADPYYPGPNRVPAVISPGSLIGGAVGNQVGNQVGPIAGVVGTVIGSQVGNAIDRTALNVVSGIFGRKMLAQQA